jgi:capsular polysaccharide biosynthesis protein
MDKNQMNSEVMAPKNREVISIDILHIVKALWHRAWIIVIAGVMAAALGFSYASFVLTPQYSSSIMLYVNNSSLSVGGQNISISASQISAAQSLVKTYIVMLQNRTTLEKVIDRADVSYTYEQLSSKIEATAVNETEVMLVTVTTGNPYEAAKIANAIAEVLPERIGEIIDGSSMEVVDSGAVNLQKVSPSITKYTMIGLILGVFLAVAVLAVLAIMDDTIHEEDYILQNYNYPILAKIPDLVNSGTKPYGYSYGYYYQRKKSTK